ncbi:metallophosphoesterase [Proteus penneri]|uniref:metallophosphoesterase n=1 Tax=Proteus penneri TaxID=102862 RepID=UPI0028FF338C|nr:metallophosphoesterase [Proteus mirabilis]HEK1829907.1 metallophosphoesterase [Proteus mirabilis]
MKNILHISDLHLSMNKKVGFNYEQARNIVEKLLSDVRNLSITEKIDIDTVFFTGDMTFSGQADEFSLFREHFLQPLINGLGITTENVYIVPGNHDMDRSAIKSSEKPLRNTYPDEELSNIFSSIDKGDEEWSRSKEYSKFIQEVSSNKNIEHSGQLCRVHKISNKLYIMCINSSWLAQDDEDKSNLRITDSQLKILDRVKIPHGAKIIALTHHPLDWLNNSDRNKFSSFIEKSISMLCFGHMHSFQQKQESNFSEGITLFLQAGTLDIRESNTGYSLILFNNVNKVDDGRVLYRKYDVNSDGFISWNERGNNGEFNYSTNSMISFDVAKFASLSFEMKEKTDTDLLINTGLDIERKKKLSILFTEPNFIEDEGLPIESVKINITKDIIDSNDNLIVFGSHSSGKTSLLKYMYIKGLEKQSYKELDLIHFYIDCLNDDFSSKYKILKAICGSYFSTELATNFEDKIKDVISNGNCIIYVDNIDVLFESKVSGFVEFISEYKNCRFIIACNKISDKEILSKLIITENIEFKAVTIGSLRRCNVRDIVSRWESAIKDVGENKLYNEITKTVNNSQLPHNYFIYSMLLAIFEVDNDVKGILSESDIIENFIEILLKKHIMATPSNKPQYKELLHFLGYFGKYCFENQKTYCSNNKLVEIAIDFNKKTLLNYDVQDYITPLVQSGILSSNKSLFQFSQSSFMYYAISYFMRHDEELRDSILSEENYLLLDKVVEYYASQNASSLKLLDMLEARTNKVITTIKDVIKKEKNLDLDSIDLNLMKKTSLLDQISTVEELENYIDKLHSDRAENDKRLDELSPLHIDDEKCDFEVESNSNDDNHIDKVNSLKKTSGPKELLENLSLYARVFRNTELSMDPQKTISIFNNIANGYIFYMKSFVVFMDEQYVIPYILPVLERKMVEDNLTSEEKTKIINLFKIVLSIVRWTMPNTIQMIMTDTISSKKPRIENIIRETRKEEAHDELKNAILGYILMDIKDDNILPIVSEISKVRNNFIQESLFLKINNLILTNYDLPRKSIESLKQSLKKIAKDREIMIMPKLSDTVSAINDNGTIE